jgi:hypothetical protein
MPDSEQESWTLAVIIGVACLLVLVSFVGFFYLRKRNKSGKQGEPMDKKEVVVVIDEVPAVDNLRNCRVYPTNHGLRVYRCDEKTGEPVSKVDI